MPFYAIPFFFAAFASLGQSINLKKLHADGQACAPLQNHEVYSSVRVKVGSKHQSFDLVADTGSDNCIVKDCTCVQCPAEWGGCFEGPKDSKTFSFTPKKESGEGDESGSSGSSPLSVVMRFGSGDIQTTVSSDEIHVGPKKAFMENGLLLMTDHTLELKGRFEGILGLGRPTSKMESDSTEGVKVPSFLERAKIQRFSLCFNRKSAGVLGLDTPEQHERLGTTGTTHWSMNLVGVGLSGSKISGICTEKCSAIPDSGTTLIAGPEEELAKLFAQVCQNWKRCTETHKKLTSEVAKMKEQGISIEGSANLLKLDEEFFMNLVSRVIASTSDSRVNSDQLSNSSRLPGSGLFVREDGQPLQWGALTTGDGKPVESKRGRALKSGAFSRSKPFSRGSLSPMKSNHLQTLGKGDAVRGAESPESRESKSKDFKIEESLTLQLLLEHCSSWMKDAKLESEMPQLSFHVTGSNGKSQELKLSATSYVISKALEVDVPAVRNVLGFPLKTRQTEVKTVCSMAFMPSDYQTVTDGNIWILGTPFFYEYTAHYDRGQGKEEDIAMSFTRQDEEQCGQCDPSSSKVRASGSLLDSATFVGMQQLNYLSSQPVLRNMTGLVKL